MLRARKRLQKAEKEYARAASAAAKSGVQEDKDGPYFWTIRLTALAAAFAFMYSRPRPVKSIKSVEVVTHHDSFAKIVPKSKFSCLANGFGWTDSPTWVVRGEEYDENDSDETLGFLLFADVSANRLYKFKKRPPSREDKGRKQLQFTMTSLLTDWFTGTHGEGTVQLQYFPEN
jgi:hypothetical protein